MSELAPAPATAPPRPAPPRLAPWGAALPVERPGLRLVAAEPLRSFSLRGARAALAPLARLIDLSLPVEIGGVVRVEARAALMLGPDEWLLTGPEQDPWWEDFRRRAEVLLREEGERAGGERVRGAVFEVSHHYAALRAEGVHVADLLNAGCPLDLDPAAFPPGRATRTLFGKIGILLWRETEQRFTLMVARSYARALAELLREAARGLGA
jgi:sarcosine oxidase subunit gamma